ncbi:type IVB secretion system protein IcmH/DotU [Pseudomonas gingeri]|uniref:DotU family type IV/VI secretion system protein n=1 Tax=Pseudomonas gingeri TaxID=117681 RepID=A0A7Y8BJ89_9PSED|nr:type IVB secretion system protein IcmH/DotU [Pseudomonas gingeri]NWB45627.1 DotU family type IV/VI secretion system protein [Pseudomonas gingeri]
MNTPSPARNNSPSVQINGDGTYPDLGKRSNYRPPALSKRLADCRPDALGQKPQPSREIFEAGINPLTGAASGLLGFAIEIKHDDKPHDLDLLFQDLADQFRTFTHKAQRKGFKDADIKTAHYLLCSLIDESIMSLPWAKAWSDRTLLGQFHDQTCGGEEFFRIMERYKKLPMLNVEFIELMYLCLSLGFKGQYALLPRGEEKLEAIHKELHGLIQHARGPVPLELSPHWLAIRPDPSPPIHIVSGWKVLAFTLIALALMYTGFAWDLAVRRAEVLEIFKIPKP